MAAGLAGEELDALLAGLITPEVIYFPIRHHSPACAWNLARLIRERKPHAILIEGPSSFTPLIPLLLDKKKTKPPVAFYTSFAPKLPDGALRGIDIGPLRFAAYYPFCDYSPEYVALRAGSEVGAHLQFIDLDYASHVEAQRDAVVESGTPRVDSLLSERHLKRSRFLTNLARRAGCRDHNDLWDHLFETRIGKTSEGWEQFVRDVASWCHFARLDASPDDLKADGTLAREAEMAANIRQVLRNAAPAVVVTGGFHAVALPGLIAPGHSAKTAAKPAARQDVLTCFVRYSYEQLDALNGYAAGMPSPFYYDQLWRAAQAGETAEPFIEVAAKTLVQLGQLTRRKKMANALSAADEIAGLEQARRLAALRAHPGPTREDLLDGVRSCFVKGSMDAEGEVLLALARHTLAGTSIGEVPPEAGVPPIVANFRALARELRLNIADSVKRKSSLDLYRKTTHRRCSRFFHSLAFLRVPFAVMTGGPDFVRGIGLERLHEHWDYRWSPQTEGSLIEASVYGATIEEAAVNRLLRAVGELEQQGRGRNAVEAVALLIEACRMGLHTHTESLRNAISRQIAEDPNLQSLAGALSQLVLLYESREPLEAFRLPDIPLLIGAAYLRASYLLRDLGNTPTDAAHGTLQALLVVRSVLHTKVAAEVALDPNLFFDSLRPILADPKAPPLLAGAGAGLLYGDGRINDTQLQTLLEGFLNSAAPEPGNQMEFLIGLLRTCRELAWRQPALVEAIEKLLGAWSEDEFVQRLPHLRLAFADLTPRETDQVAGLVAGLHGRELDHLVHNAFSEAEMLAALRLDAEVRKSLDRDGLSDWIVGDLA